MHSTLHKGCTLWKLDWGSRKAWGGGGGRSQGVRGYLEGAEHGQEGLSNDKAEEQVAEGSYSKASRACLQGLDLGGVQPGQRAI